MKKSVLDWKFRGEGYNQILALEKQGECLFESAADELVTSVGGGVILKLNYGKELIYPHEIKRIGGNFLMIPRFSNISRDYHSLSSPPGRVLEYYQLLELWKSLRYPVQELDEIPAATSEEVIACWLLNSCVVSWQFSDFKRFQREVESCIIAVDPSEFETDKLFLKLTQRVIDTVPVSFASGRDVVFFVEQEDQIYEWQGAIEGTDCVNLIIDSENIISVGY